MVWSVLSIFAFTSLGTSLALSDHPRCNYPEPCWPSLRTWAAFNRTISGRLIASRPTAAVCHREHYDESACAIAREQWNVSFWRTDQVGGYGKIFWEVGDDECLIRAPIDAPCGQGLVPQYSVAAREVSDIQTAVRFAKKHNLHLVVKNTGHDYLGRSGGEGSFSIWTHNLKGRTWHDSFRPHRAPKRKAAVPAVTLQAGEQWLDVYRDAAEKNVIVVGGHARTVGAAGGWLTGGGHSAWSHFYGLGVDNLLEVNIVTASGEHKTINEYTDPDYFYAIRGGAGSAWGVITSVTYKTHPSPTHIQLTACQFNASNTDAHRKIITEVFKSLPGITDAGYTGYGILSGGFSAIFIQPNGTNATADSAFASLKELASEEGVSGQLLTFNVPSWIAHVETFITDIGIATNYIDASRLISAEVMLEKTDELVDFVLKAPEASAGFGFIGKVNSENRDNTAAHDAWKTSRALLGVSVSWEDDAPLDLKLKKRQESVKLSLELGEIVGKNGGTYVNEANAFEPDWQNVFWGRKYKKLLRIKKRIDPTNLFTCNRCVGSTHHYSPRVPLTGGNNDEL